MAGVQIRSPRRSLPMEIAEPKRWDDEGTEDNDLRCKSGNAPSELFTLSYPAVRRHIISDLKRIGTKRVHSKLGANLPLNRDT